MNDPFGVGIVYDRKEPRVPGNKGHFNSLASEFVNQLSTTNLLCGSFRVIKPTTGTTLVRWYVLYKLSPFAGRCRLHGSGGSVSSPQGIGRTSQTAWLYCKAVMTDTVTVVVLVHS